MSKNRTGIDMTVYRIRNGFLYAADDSGKKYRMKNVLGALVHVGTRLRNVVFIEKDAPKAIEP